MKKALLLCFVHLIVFSIHIQVFGEVKEVVTAGRYVMGDSDTKKDAKKLALLEAKQMALEQAGTYLKTFSQVKDYQLTGDEISSLAAGLMSVEILEEKWTMEGDNPAVIIKIKANVTPEKLEDQINSLREEEGSADEYKKIHDELASLKRELDELKNREVFSTEKGGGNKVLHKEFVQKKTDTIKRINNIQSLEEANANLRQGRLQEALRGFDEVIAADPSNFLAHLNRALALDRLNKSTEALNELNKLLEIKPKSWRANSQKAHILLKNGDIYPSVRLFTTAIDINPECGRCFLGRGTANLKLRKFKKAHRDFKKACELGKSEGCNRARRMDAKRREIKESRQQRRQPAGPRRPLR